MQTEQEIRQRLAAITAELDRGVSHSRLIVLYNRQQALLWVLGEIEEMVGE